MGQDLNSVQLIGRLTRDVELKYLSSGTAVSKFSIAVNRRKKDGESWKDEASFFDVTLFGKLGETLGQYLLKGKQVAITGSLEQQRWEKDGQTQSKIIINAENIQLLGDKKDGQESRPEHRQQREPPKVKEPINPEFFPEPDFESDIPF